MKKHILFLLIFFLGNLSAFSQGYWNKLYADLGFALVSIVEVNGGYVVSGDIYNPTVVASTITKISYKGDTLWRKVIGTDPKLFAVTKLIKTKDGNVALTGYTQDSITSNYESPADVIIGKINSTNGATMWLQRFRTPEQDGSSDFVMTKDEGFAIIAVKYDLVPPNNGNFYLIKTDSLGNKQWEKTYSDGSMDIPNRINNTNDGGYVLAGSCYNNGLYIIKVDSLGNKQWEKTYGIPHVEFGGTITQLADKSYLITTIAPTGGQPARLIKIDNLGGILWQKDYPYGSLSAFQTAPIENNDGTLVLGEVVAKTSATNALGYLIKLNAVGDTIWSRTYAPNDHYPTYIYDLRKTSDEGFIFCGSAFDDTSNVERSWTAKTDCMGNDSIHYPPQGGCCGMYSAQVLSNKTNYSFCKGDSITLTVSHSYTSYTWSNNATSQSITVKQGGNYTVTIASAGGCILTLPFLVQMDTLPKPVITKNDSVLTSNYSSGNMWYLNGQYIPAATGQVYIAHTTGTYTLAVTNSCGTGTSQPVITLGVSPSPSGKNNVAFIVWPNPVTGGILHIEGIKNTDTIEFYNLLGEKMLQTKGSGTTDISGLPKGVYFVKLQNTGGERVCKIVIQ